MVQRAQGRHRRARDEDPELIGLSSRAGRGGQRSPPQPMRAMTSATIARRRDQDLRRPRAGRRRGHARHRCRRVLLPAGPVGLRQDHVAAHDRGLRDCPIRAASMSAAATSPTCRCTSATWAWCSSPMPCSRIAPWPRTWPSACACARCRKPDIDRRVDGGAGPGRADRPGRAQARPALGRPAAARGARPRARDRAAGAAVRRAAGRARPQAAPADAVRAEGAAEAAGRHPGLRHPRPGRGAGDERPHRRDEPRPGRAGRRADRDLRAAAHALRRRLHRRDQYPGGGRPRPRAQAGEDPPGAAGRGARFGHRRDRELPGRLDALSCQNRRRTLPARARDPRRRTRRRATPGDAVGLMWNDPDTVLLEG